jgi:hypothetical protein
MSASCIARFTTITLLVGCWFIVSVARAEPADKTITIEGRAAGTDRSAMEQARQDALRRAVEQACGTFINAQSRVKNYSAVYDKVMSQAQGYVNEYEVLEQRVENDESVCKVRAKVSTKSFETEWARLAHTLESEDNPRCVVAVVEDNDVEDENPPKAHGVAQSMLERFFLDKGMQLMDQGATRDTRSRDVELAALNNDVNKLAAAAAAFRADVVIAGRAEARHAGSSQIAGRTVYKWSATLNLRAYHTDSAQMLMSGTYTATATTVHQNAGGDEALRKCAEENAGKILRDIGDTWRKRQVVRRSLQITLENCARADYKVFEDAMRRVDGVQNVRMRELVNNVCQVEIDWSYDLARLIDRIEELELNGVTFVVTEQTHDRATFKLAR